MRSVPNVFNDLDYIFLAPNWKRLVPDQKPLGELRPGPTYMAGRAKPSSRINIKTFQVGQQTGSTVWPRYAQVTTLRCEPDRPTPPSIGSHASLNTAIASARVGAQPRSVETPQLPSCRFQKLDSSVPVMQSAQDCMCDDVPRSGRSGARPAHPFRAKHEDATHYNRRRISQGSASGALR